MKQKFFSALFGLFLLFVSVGVAMADGGSMPSTFSVAELVPDMSAVGTLATAICGGLFALWGIRKVIKLVNRS